MSNSNKYIEKILKNFECPSNVFAHIITKKHNEIISWGDLEIECKRTISTLNKSVDEKGVVLIFLRHQKELFSTFLGCMLGGYTPSFMPCSSPRQDPTLYWQSHQKLINTILPCAIITSSDVAKEMKDASLDLQNASLFEIEKFENDLGEFVIQNETNIALLQHSSGTTGLKKGVALSFQAIHAHAISYGKSIKLNKNDKIVSWLPLYHDMGLMACFITPAFHSITTIQIDAFDWVTKPEILFDNIMAYNGTLTWLPNFAFEHMSNIVGKKAEMYDLSSMRAFINCSETCKAATFDKFLNSFKVSKVIPNQLQCCYAMAEVVFGVTQTKINNIPERIFVEKNSLNRNDSIILTEKIEGAAELIETGEIIDGLKIEIVDENRNQLELGRIGEITISGDFLFSGYNKDSVQTKERLIEGHYYSRDLGFIHNNKIYVLGRVDDLIIINGRNIYAHQIEAIANSIEGVKPGRAVAVSYFEERVGSEVLVIIAEKLPSAIGNEVKIIKNIMMQVLSAVDVTPKAVKLVEPGWLVKTSSGKISRKENLKKYLKK